MVNLVERGKVLCSKYLDEGKCAICGTNIEVQGHHVYPTSLGGPKDGPLLPLCSKDHLMIHHLSGKNSTIPPGFSEQQIKIIKLLVQFIQIAKIQYESIDPTWIDRKIIINVPHALLKRLHKRKLDQGFSNIQDYVMSLIVKDTLSL